MEDLYSKVFIALVLFIVGAIEALGGLYSESKRTRDDFTIELISLFTLPLIIQPAIFLFVIGTMTFFFPQFNHHFFQLSVFIQIFAFLIFDDLSQYWWHRLSHQYKLLWKLHRPHHVIEEMGVLVTYRNAMLYYALMPGIWLSAVLVYLGMGTVYIYYLPIKLTVILLAHSETKWDRFLYNYKILNPLAWIIERCISTPSTHFAHHGLSKEDGISNPNGNYGNLLFVWDIIFGTAKITRKYPEKFGAWNQLKENWSVQLFFPFIKSKDADSELNDLFTNSDYDPKVDFEHFKK